MISDTQCGARITVQKPFHLSPSIFLDNNINKSFNIIRSDRAPIYFRLQFAFNAVQHFPRARTVYLKHVPDGELFYYEESAMYLASF